MLDNRVWKSVSIFLFVSLIFNILAWVAVFDLNHPYLEVNFFDVGQGDAIFITTPQNHQILIDGGPTPKISEKLGREMPFWDRTLDLIILTHPEYDHLAGLIEVLKNYKVENILWTGVVRDTAVFGEWQNLIEKENTRIQIAAAGQKIIFSDEKNFGKIDILYPFENLAGQKFKDSNNTSIITKLVFGNDAFLFAGDAGNSTEKKLIEKQIDLSSDVLKVGHHGSKTASGEEFIKKVSPEIAVISAGKDNKYGHPDPQVLDTLTKYGIKIVRTDEVGDIKIVSDGNNFKIK